jgi:hypothetical protein
LAHGLQIIKTLEIKMDTGVIKIHGKEYQTVALRVQKFREQHPDWQIHSELLKADDKAVIIRVDICDQDGKHIASGHAEEFRAASKINSTSALENCETSALGRALAAAGFGGTEFASANEVQGAIAIQDELLKQYETAYLPKMRESAMAGIDALRAAYKSLPKSPYRDEFWKVHGPALEAAAKAVK